MSVCKRRKQFTDPAFKKPQSISLSPKLSAPDYNVVSKASSTLAQYPLAADKTTYTRYHLPFALYVPQPHERNELLTNRKMNDHPFDVHKGAAHYHFPRFYTRENQTKKKTVLLAKTYLTLLFM